MTWEFWLAIKNPVGFWQKHIKVNDDLFESKEELTTISSNSLSSMTSRQTLETTSPYSFRICFTVLLTFSRASSFQINSGFSWVPAEQSNHRSQSFSKERVTRSLNNLVQDVYVIWTFQIAAVSRKEADLVPNMNTEVEWIVNFPH